MMFIHTATTFLKRYPVKYATQNKTDLPLPDLYVSTTYLNPFIR